jgi:two-component system OmpR family response regulator
MRQKELARCRSHVRFTGVSHDHRVRVLVAEDDVKLSRLLERGLTEAGMRVTLVGRGDEALESLRADSVDVAVLDVMLPGLDGFAVCAELRAAHVWTPVLMLTARAAVEDRVRGLDGGADDYLPKPFSFAELTARLRALARRGPVVRPTVLELSTTERRLLETFMRHPGQLLDRDQLLDHVWGIGQEPRSNVLDVYVRYLREKIDRPFGVTSIETVRGTGYRLRRDGGRGS